MSSFGRSRETKRIEVPSASGTVVLYAREIVDHLHHQQQNEMRDGSEHRPRPLRIWLGQSPDLREKCESLAVLRPYDIPSLEKACPPLQPPSAPLSAPLPWPYGSVVVPLSNIR